MQELEPTLFWRHMSYERQVTAHVHLGARGAPDRFCPKAVKIGFHLTPNRIVFRGTTGSNIAAEDVA